MRTLASQLTTYVCRGRAGNVQFRNFSSYNGKDDLALEQDAERKIGWLLKLLFAGTAAAVGYQFFPYMGDNLMQQSVSLLKVKDPLFKRMGASRLTRFAIDGKFLFLFFSFFFFLLGIVMDSKFLASMYCDCVRQRVWQAEVLTPNLLSDHGHF
ncbi:hypothetical protein CISIN_1g031228mg [Citrus sinensis]|uniref:Uncharacterized protein n=1 Tax=Citrus sinensis TaxID=2711 RepID=A0A067CYT9_CITSI|nr:hypothetical protein CISIN_1g031228mg [Citrus sinensis]